MQTAIVESGWDGTYKGQIVQPGIYVYQVEYITADNKQEIKMGDLALIR